MGQIIFYTQFKSKKKEFWRKSGVRSNFNISYFNGENYTT